MRSLAELSQAFPVQVINPSVHKLVVEDGYRRRPWVDWAVFHVEPQLRTWTPEPEFRGRWRRNAALRSALARQMRSASIAEPPSKLSQPGAFPSRGIRCRLIGPLINPIRQDNPSIASPERQCGSPLAPEAFASCPDPCTVGRFGLYGKSHCSSLSRFAGFPISGHRSSRPGKVSVCERTR